MLARCRRLAVLRAPLATASSAAPSAWARARPAGGAASSSGAGGRADSTSAPASPASAPAASSASATAASNSSLAPELAFDGEDTVQWEKTFAGISSAPFAPEVAAALLAPVDAGDIEVKPDGQPYLPEIKYRRILNKAFGPGGWGLVPRGPHTVNGKNVSREYALFCLGRFVSQARGEQDYFGKDSLPTASEGCKSNALMRCCKDLGIASELWDPVFVQRFKKSECEQVAAVHLGSRQRKHVWRKRGRDLEYPFQAV